MEAPYTQNEVITTLSEHIGDAVIHVTSSDKTTWNAKQNTITGGATTIVSNNLTASKALVSNIDGKVDVSTVSSTELGYLSGATSSIQTQLNNKQGSLSQTQLDAVNSGITSTLVGKISTNESNISTINEKIPSEASSLNQLADKAFVNNAIQTNSASFRGNWDTWADVPTSSSDYPVDAYGSRTPTANDYLVINDPSDYTGQTLSGTWRFKYIGAWSTDGKSGWIPEYQENQPLSPAQQAAVDSGISSAKVSNYDTHIADTTIHVTSSDKTTWSAKQDAITGGATTIVSNDLTTSRALVSDSSGKVAVSSVTDTELGYISGTTSSIQTQLNAKQGSLSEAQLNAVNSGITSTKVGNYDTHIADIDIHVTSSDKSTWNSKQNAITGGATSIISSDLTASKVLVSDSSGKVAAGSIDSSKLVSTDGTQTLTNKTIAYSDNTLTGVQPTLTTTEQNAVDSGITSTKVGNYDTHIADTDIHVTTSDKTAWSGKQDAITGAASSVVSSNLTASKALVSDSSGKIGVSSTSSTELGYVAGVTSSIQTQLNSKQGTLSQSQLDAANSGITSSKVSGYDTHVANTDIHVTATDKSAWTAKQDAITGAATTIVSNDLTASKALISNASGKVDISSVSSTELGYLSGVTSSIQTQLGNKQATLDSDQLNAVNSGITSSKVSDYDTHIADTTIHVTSSDKTTWSGKQDALVSGTNIKTINSSSILGSGDIEIDGLPSQTGNSGKFLTTDGTDASWSANFGRLPYGTSSTAADTVEKVVSIPEITELNVGQVIIVKPTITSTVASSTIKLNDFPAYKMLYNANEITTSTDSVVWSANIPSLFYFDKNTSGTVYYWRFLGHGLDSNTTYTMNYGCDSGQYTSGTGSYAITRYAVCAQKADFTWEKIVDPTVTYSTGTSKSVNTHGFILNQLRYYYTTTTYSAGKKIATNTMYTRASSVNMAYSTNCGSEPGWSIGQYIYLVGTIGVDGLFYFDTIQWWTLSLPSVNDGKLYIRFGLTLSDEDATCSFLGDRPIFYHDGTGIKEYKVADNKQDLLVSGTNIKTINNTSILGSGNIEISAGDSLPDQTGHAGEFLTTDGTDASWASVGKNYTSTPVATGNTLNGKPILARSLSHIGQSTSINISGNLVDVKGTYWIQGWKNGSSLIKLLSVNSVYNNYVDGNLYTQLWFTSEIINGVATFTIHDATDYEIDYSTNCGMDLIIEYVEDNTVYTVSVSDLSTTLQNLPANSVDAPYKLNITSTLSDVDDIPDILNDNYNKFVDISYTTLPIDSSDPRMPNFSDCGSIVKLPAIPSGITNLDYAFSGCVSLRESPVIPNSVTSMEGTFNGCFSLLSAPAIPSVVTSIRSLFYGCTSLIDISNFNIPSGIESLDSLFSGCSSLSDISSLVIPNTVTDISLLFSDCLSLTDNDVLDLEIPDSVVSMYGAFSNCILLTDLYNFTIPNSVINMGYAFSGCSSLIYAPNLPNSVENLGYTFSWCTELTLIPEIPDSVQSIEYAFSYCSKIVSAPSIPSNSSLIYVRDAFKGCTSLIDISNFNIPSGITSLEGLFSGCSSLVDASSLVIPNTVTDVSKLFEDCSSLNKAPEIPNGVTNMNTIFKGCTGLVNFPEIPDSVTNISYAFSACYSLVNPPVIPNSVTEMSYAFNGCYNLVDIPELPYNVQYLRWAFHDCTKLTDISNKHIPMTVTNLINTFGRCTNLTKVSIDVVNWNNCSTGSIFKDCVSLDTINVLSSNSKSVLSSKLTSGTDYPNSLNISEVIKVASDEVINVPFSKLGNLLVNLDNNTVNTSYKLNIAELTTSNCGSSSTNNTLGNILKNTNYSRYVDLSYTTLPNELTSMSSTFNGCTKLVISPKVPSGVTSLNKAFYYCSSLTTVKEIDITDFTNVDISSSFYSCTSLTDVYVPSSSAKTSLITKLGDDASNWPSSVDKDTVIKVIIT